MSDFLDFAIGMVREGHFNTNGNKRPNCQCQPCTYEIFHPTDK